VPQEQGLSLAGSNQVKADQETMIRRRILLPRVIVNQKEGLVRVRSLPQILRPFILTLRFANSFDIWSVRLEKKGFCRLHERRYIRSGKLLGLQIVPIGDWGQPMTVPKPRHVRWRHEMWVVGCQGQP